MTAMQISCLDSSCRSSFIGSIPVQINSILDYEMQLHWTTRCLIRACVLLSLWNLPFPWVHNHDLALESEQGVWLPSHLEEYHGIPESDEHGWHLHFVYLGMDNCNNPLEKKFPAQHHFITGESANSLPACGYFSADQLQSARFVTVMTEHVVQRNQQAHPVHGDRAAGLHFMQAFQQRSLRDLISISLC
ncbi:hypothetical protein [Gimesia algae]|uniref:Uncharacterized protein n=1 Tax=Gimesia algae TaxID=2527971 RepID=A0A517VFW0_9PLAN|nr:hypothetical protein [Gimesia algae]QDT91884.1 hypothetical protein Pan161_35480 [Gimesia algae]